MQLTAYSWFLTATENNRTSSFLYIYNVLFHSLPNYSCFLFRNIPSTFYSSPPVFSQNTQKELYRLLFIPFGHFSADRNVNQAYMRTGGTPKGYINIYGFKHNISMGIFSCGEGLLLSSGVSFCQGDHNYLMEPQNRCFFL